MKDTEQLNDTEKAFADMCFWFFENTGTKLNTRKEKLKNFIEDKTNTKNSQKSKNHINLTENQLKQLKYLEDEYVNFDDKPCAYYLKKAQIAFGSAVELTIEEISWVLECTRERVRELEGQAIKKLRHPNNNAAFREYVKL
ncbi:MAG: hypothetical protein LBH45_00760 [Campylobacteraceae bacterium]|jgi:DNA-directed RNA polymerase sigma subunit (sigma70/sigma32)|nr:hypothetical protein [Campylobacteraceae bacterium]